MSASGPKDVKTADPASLSKKDYLELVKRFETLKEELWRAKNKANSSKEDLEQYPSGAVQKDAERDQKKVEELRKDMASKTSSTTGIFIGEREEYDLLSSALTLAKEKALKSTERAKREWSTDNLRRDAERDRQAAEEKENEFKKVCAALTSLQEYKDLFTVVCGELARYNAYLKKEITTANDKRNASLTSGKFDTENLLEGPYHYYLDARLIKDPDEKDKELAGLLTKYRWAKALLDNVNKFRNDSQLSPLEKTINIGGLLQETDEREKSILGKQEARTVKDILSARRHTLNIFSTPPGKTMIENIEQALKKAETAFKIDPAVANKPK